MPTEEASAKLVSNNVYSDMRNYDLDGRGKEQFERYLVMLSVLTRTVATAEHPNKAWATGFEEFYNLMIYDAFRALSIEPPVGMEICLSGSLARKQATPFSDLDAFVLLGHEGDAEVVMPVFKAIDNLCQRIFQAQNQLYPDPISINPAKLLGTVDQMVLKLQREDFPDSEVALRSLYVSRSISGQSALCNQLHTRLQRQFATQLSYVFFYTKAISDFTGPKPGAEIINIKSDLIRPIDFILMGLREEYKITCDDGSHLSAEGTIAQLRARSLIPSAQIDLIESVFRRALQLRFQEHLRAKAEYDDIPRSQEGVEALLSDVEALRSMVKAKIHFFEESARRRANTSPVPSPTFSASVSGFFGSARRRVSSIFAPSPVSPSPGASLSDLGSFEISSRGETPVFGARQQQMDDTQSAGPSPLPSGKV